jgi:hypothetical protein
VCKQNAASLFALIDLETSCLGCFSSFFPESCIDLCIRGHHVLAGMIEYKPKDLYRANRCPPGTKASEETVSC